MRRRVRRMVGGTLAFALAVSAPAMAADKMVIGTGVDPTLSQFHLGAEAGIFKKHGLDVEVKLFASGAASAPLLIPGDIQASLTGAPTGALVHTRASKVVLVAMTNITTNYFGVLGDVVIKDIPSLRGQKVAIAIGSTSEVFAIQTLERFNMTVRDVQVVNVEPPEMLAALQRKNVSAFFIWEPWLTRGKMAMGNQAHLLPGTDFYQIQNHLLMDREWIERNRDVSIRFLRAIKEAGEFAKERPDEAARMVSKFLKLDLELVKELLAKCNFVMVLNDAAMQYMKKEVDALIGTKRLAGPFDYAGYIYPNLLREIDPKAVNYTAPR